MLGAIVSCTPVDEVPSPDREMQARLTRIADLIGAASDGRSPGVDRLAEEIDNLCRFPPAATASRALAQAILDGVDGRPVSLEARRRLAMHLYSLANGGYLQRRSVERVTLRLEQELIAAGVPALIAGDARAAGMRVAREPRSTRANWW
jgi:hypothetical protein